MNAEGTRCHASGVIFFSLLFPSFFALSKMRHAQLVMGPAGCGVYLCCKFSSSVCLCVCGHSYARRSLLTQTVLCRSLLVTLLNLEVCCLILQQGKVS
jgi:hypothetical protein